MHSLPHADLISTLERQKGVRSRTLGLELGFMVSIILTMSPT